MAPAYNLGERGGHALLLWMEGKQRGKAALVPLPAWFWS